MIKEWIHFESEEVRNRFLRRIAVEFALLFLLLTGLGFMLQTKVVGLLNASMEDSLTQIAADVALLMEARFQTETGELGKAASAAAEHPEDIPIMLAHLKGESDEVGILYAKDRFDTSRTVNRVVFPGIGNAFLGYPVMDFARDHGLVFAVPVMRGGNVQGIFYRYYKQENLAKHFSIARFKRNAARFIICRNDCTPVMPYEVYADDYMDIFLDETVYNGFSDVGEKLKNEKAAALYYGAGGERYFLMAADIANSNLRVLGFVPWEAVAGYQFHIYDLVLGVFVLLMVLFVAISMYLFYQQARAEESDELRRAKSTAEEARRVADDANRAKSEFLANMSHEIRTPINAVLGLDEMILRETKEASTRQHAKDIASAGKSLLGLINDVLDFSNCCWENGYYSCRIFSRIRYKRYDKSHSRTGRGKEPNPEGGCGQRCPQCASGRRGQDKTNYNKSFNKCGKIYGEGKHHSVRKIRTENGENAHAGGIRGGYRNRHKGRGQGKAFYRL